MAQCIVLQWQFIFFQQWNELCHGMLVYVPWRKVIPPVVDEKQLTKPQFLGWIYRQFMEDINVYYSSIMIVHIPAKVQLCFITKESTAQYNQSVFLEEHTKPLTVT